MSQVLPTTSSSTNFQSVFNAALEAYENKTKNKLLTHPLAARLQPCISPAAVLSVLQDLVQQNDQNRNSDDRFRKWLNPTVNVLYAFSATISEGVGLVFSPAKMIFAGIGVLLLAAKEVDANQDVLVDLFERIEGFFKRLESYTEVSPTAAMMETIVKIIVEVFIILGIATREIRQSRTKKYLKKLVGKNDIEDALKRLDKLTQEEARMATAEVLKITHSVDDKAKVLIDATEVLQHTADETKEIIQRTASEAAVTMQQTASNVDNIQQSQLREKMQKWLSPPDSSTSHNVARSAQHEGTATWFFQGGIYKDWKSTSSLLWIHGKPGSGKSVLCSSIIQDIMTQCQTGSASIAYFYCDFRDEDKQSRHNILTSILFQLSASSYIYSDILSRLYLAHKEGELKPNDGTLTQCLKEMLLIPSEGPVYLITDAIDECPDNSGMPTSREEVLGLLEELVNLQLPHLHICVTSRPEIDIRTTLEPLTSLNVSLHDQSGQKQDILDYVNSVVYSDKKMRRWREEDKRLVIETLSERANGMFRWVYCQLETLRHCLPPSIRGILDELPETLDETYERILRDINKANRDHALRLLHCLTVAIRPLRVEELAEILAIDFDAALQGGIPKSNPNWRWADQHQAVLSTCSSLIAIVDDGDYQVVQFSHFSVKEFLISDRLAHSSGDVSRYHIHLEPAHTILAQACLGVLLNLDGSVGRHNVEDAPLAGYAARYWVDHARFESVSTRIQVAMEYLFDADKPHLETWLSLHDIDHYTWFMANPGIPRAHPLYYAALCGLYDLAKCLTVKHPEHVNSRGGMCATPLVAALIRKHFRIADMLHRHGADVDVRDQWNRTLLHPASANGDVDTVQWLLSHGMDVNSLGQFSWSALHMACHRGNVQVVQALLEHDADINARDNKGAVPLHIATTPTSPLKIDNQTLMLQLLLDHGADVNAQDNEASTPLHYSSLRISQYGGERISGTVEGSRILLEHGANIDAENNVGETPRQRAIAARSTNDRIAEFLAECGAK